MNLDIGISARIRNVQLHLDSSLEQKYKRRAHDDRRLRGRSFGTFGMAQNKDNMPYYPVLRTLSRTLVLRTVTATTLAQLLYITYSTFAMDDFRERHQETSEMYGR